MILSLTAAILTFLGIQGLLWLIKKRRFLLDIPNERSSHTQPTPRGGGVMIVIVTMVGLWVTLLLTHSIQPSLTISYSVAALLVAAVSWLDDLRPLSNRLRFSVHILSACVIIIGVGYWQNFTLPILGNISIGFLGIPFTLVWIVGLINAYNFMDGIDGLAGTVALIAGSAWALIGYYYGSALVVDLGLLVAASSLGFLLHNWFPAKIFMGDVGSAFLGLTFATFPLLTLRLATKEPSANLFLATGMLVIWPFLFDSIFTFLRRLSNGEKVWEAHRSHLYQRLVIAGFRHSFVTVLYAGCTMFGVFLAVVWILNRLGDTKIIVITLLMISALLVGYVSSKEVKVERNGRFSPLLNLNLTHLRNRHFFLLDILTLALTPTLALMLRLDTLWILREFWSGLVIYTLLGIVLRPLLFQRFGVYSRYWRYASIDEGVQIVLAVAVSTAVLVIITLPLMATLVISFARSILIIDTLLILVAVSSTRFSLRFWGHNAQVRVPDQKRVVIIGAGDAGEMTARELQKYPQLGLKLVAFVDDDPQKQGLHLRGLPILGTRRDLPRIVLSEAIDQVIIAMPTVSGDVIREITGVCEMLGVETKTIPGISEIMNDQLRPHQLRDVEIEDLLRREPVQTDIQAVRRLVAGKRVLVTGGGGSIGSELCRQLLYCGPSELLILGHGENSVFEIYHELHRIGLQGPKLTPLIADVRFGDRILALFKQHRPQLVFHAAAHKHVPLMEQNPAEAITNNTLGTQHVVAAALAVNVERFVMISTDKAVNPTSVMGASKRSAELLVHRAARESKRPFVTVRFGNVLGSRGSVVLTFKKQIEMGGPITITHPDIERYFMTIPEAVQLVLQASVLGTGGEVFVLDMGQPIKIVDLARDLIRLSGLEVGRDIEIKAVGLRPGEKLYEELFVAGEQYHRTTHEKIFIAENASKFVPHDLETSVEMLALAAANNDTALILRQLQQLIPEYQPLPGKDASSSAMLKEAIAVPQRGELQTLTP